MQLHANRIEIYRSVAAAKAFDAVEVSDSPHTLLLRCALLRLHDQHSQATIMLENNMTLSPMKTSDGTPRVFYRSLLSPGDTEVRPRRIDSGAPVATTTLAGSR